MTEITENVDLGKFQIPKLCNGSVTLSASIAEVGDLAKDDNSKSTSIGFNVTDSGVSLLTGITIAAGETYELDVDSASSKVNTPDNMTWIPAFYKSGRVDIRAVIASTANDDDVVDLIFDVVMYVKTADKPTWYPYDLNYQTIDDKKCPADVIDGIITSSNAEVKGVYADNTPADNTWNIGVWNGMRPIVAMWPTVGEMNEKHVGCLPPLSFLITCKNNTTDSVTLSSFTANFTFNYDTNATLMNLGSLTAKDFVLPYCGPKKLPTDTNDRELWAIVDGRSKDEVVKVFGYFYKTAVDGLTRDLQTVVLEPITETGGSNYDSIVWKSSPVIPLFDNTRIINRGFESGEIALVVTPAFVCQDDKFKDINVTCKKVMTVPITDPPTPAPLEPDYLPCGANDPDAIFFIKIQLRDDVEEVTMTGGLAKAEFDRCIKTVKFFDEDKPYVDCSNDAIAIQVKRSDIDPVFYETLYGDFSTWVVLESRRDDVDPNVQIKINSQSSWIPLYNGRPIKFSESLSRCTDGVRAWELWKQGDTVADPYNIITINPNSKKRYKVLIQLEYGKYKGMTVHKFS